MERSVFAVSIIALVAIAGFIVLLNPSITGAVVKEEICERNYVICFDHAENQPQKQMCADIFMVCMHFGP